MFFFQKKRSRTALRVMSLVFREKCARNYRIRTAYSTCAYGALVTKIRKKMFKCFIYYIVVILFNVMIISFDIYFFLFKNY